MSEVVEEFVTQPFAFVRAGDETGNVEQLDGHAAPAVDARAVVGFTSVLEVVARAGAVYLEVAYCTLGVDGCEPDYGILISSRSRNMTRLWG